MPTGIEEAAAVLTLVSFAFQTFAGCIEGFKLFTTARRKGKDGQLLVQLLRLDEYRLIVWAQKTGLLEDSLDPRLNPQIVTESLGELKLLFQETSKLKQRYGLEIKEESVSSPQSRQADPISDSDISKIFEHEAVIQKEADILNKVKKSQQHTPTLKKLWWAAVDAKGIGKLIDHINSILFRLEGLLETFEREDSSRMLKQLQLSMISVAEKLSDIQTVQDTIKKATVQDETCITVAALKALQINLENVSQGPSHSDPELKAPVRQAWRLEDILPISASSHAATGKYDGQHVYVEKKQYSASDVEGERGAKFMARMEHLVLLLATPKPPSFRTLHCLGSVQDPKSTSWLFLFESPSHLQPQSLLSYLQSSFIPSIDDRWHLATVIATTLLHLHAGGWLHKGLRSENVIFFPSALGAPRSLNEPYVMGYEFARGDDPAEISDKPSSDPSRDVYRHPNAQGPTSSSFIKAYDIYALGIMLLEIAYWKPFSKIIEKLIGSSKVSAILMKNIRTSLLTDTPTGFIQNVRFRMGNHFASVVAVCLSTAFERAMMPAPEFLTLYFEKVIEPLRQQSFK